MYINSLSELMKRIEGIRNAKRTHIKKQVFPNNGTGCITKWINSKMQ